MTRSIGLWGAVVTLVGIVIGVSIYILPGALAATAGPAVILSYLLAAFLAVFSCTVAAQLGAALPVSGASFVSVSRLVSPMWGFLAVWMNLGGGVVGVALLAFGFADYLQLVWPAADRTTAAAALVIALGGLNLLGARDTIIGQALMVAAFMIALVVFVAAGGAHVVADRLMPFMPNGLGPVLSAAIPAYFSFAGFTFIIDIGGEIKDPARNIPRALAISFLLVLAVYVAVATVIVGNVPWQELGGVSAPVGEVAGRVLPGWLATGITLTAIAAAATSVNAILLAYSRDLLAMARVGLLPQALTRISPRHGEPSNGVLLTTALCLGAVLIGARVTDYAVLAVVGLLALQILLAMAALRLPKIMTERYRVAGFRLKRRPLRFFAVGLAVCSTAFLVIVLVDSAGLLLLAAGYLGIGLGCFALQNAALARRGQRLRDLIDEEAARAGRR
jgi:APA family basic amino acid/polyamine antiporter